MENNLLTPAEFVKKLCEVSGLSQKELAVKLKITPQTLSNWSVGKTRNFDPSLIKSIGDIMKSNPDWGIKLGTITRSRVQIINNSPSSNANTKSTPNDGDLADQIIKHYIKYSRDLENKLSNLESEFLILKEKLEKYGTKK